MQFLQYEMLIFIMKMEPPGASWGLLGASWEPLEGLLGASGRPLGASWGLLGASWGHSGASAGVGFRKAKIRSVTIRGRCVLEASWGHLGAVLGPSWGHLGVSLGHLGAILGDLKRS